MNTDLITSLGFSGAGPVGLQAYLIVAAVLFVLGLAACMARRNAVGILIGVELILNAAVLNFMAFWRFAGAPLGAADPGAALAGPLASAAAIAPGAALAGPLAGIFIIILAACEAAVALAILLNLYFNFGTVEVDSVRTLKR